jgi:L-serine deaminase
MSSTSNADAPNRAVFATNGTYVFDPNHSRREYEYDQAMKMIQSMVEGPMEEMKNMRLDISRIANSMESLVKTMDLCLRHLIYAPGGSGEQEASEHFAETTMEEETKLK